MLKVTKYNDVYIKVQCEQSIAYELREYFTFDVPDAKFTPKYKSGQWDGKIRLYNTLNKRIYAGLLLYVQKFADDRSYDIEIHEDLYSDEYSLKEAEQYVKTLIEEINFVINEKQLQYQIKAFTHAIRHRRSLLLSPTGSGKSLIIYFLTAKMLENNNKVLIIVPTISILAQMKQNFKNYNFNDDVCIISGDSDKSWQKLIKERVVISTWQSIYKLPKKWFSQFNAIIGDEAHQYKAKSLISIMTKLENCQYRFGLTGTIDGAETNKLTLEGLFGPLKKITTTDELIKEGILSNLDIECITLKHHHKARKMSYREETDYLIANSNRNMFITNLTRSIKGNTLVLFQYVEKHGKFLHEMIKNNIQDDNRNIFFVYGGTDVEYREKVREITEQEQDAIIIASYGTFSTGVDIKRLHNIIFASPTKSRIRTLQSIGRALRKSSQKDKATIFDICDDINGKNYSIKHFIERNKYYNDQKFNYRMHRVKLND